MIDEPAVQADDTPPHGLTLEDTQPSLPARPRRPMDPWWIFLAAVIVFSLMSLTLTIGVSLLPPQETRSTPITRSIRLVVAGEQIDAQTTAATVAELLAEQNIQLGPEDALSDMPETLLDSGMTIYIDRARTIELLIDGQSTFFRTPFDNPYDILQSADVSIGADDRIWIDGTETDAGSLILWPVPVTMIEVKRAISVTIDDGGIQTTYRTTAATVGDLLFETGETLYLADQVSPEMGTPLTNGLQIFITRASPITIEVDNTLLETRVQGGTVREALIEAAVTLIGLDYTIPPEDTPLSSGMTIRVIRVTEDLLTERRLIPYETQYQADASLELDTIAVVQAGLNGIQEIRTRVRYENGIEISRVDDGFQEISAPVTEIVRYGTQVVIRTVDTPEGPREYWRALPRMLTTTYHPAALGGDDVTSIGMKLTKGIIASDPRVIPYRTQLYVPGYGIGIMADTGGPRSTRYWLDLGYDDENWVSWRSYTTVYLLTPVPAEIDYLLPAR